MTLYRKCFREGIFPTVRKVAKVVVLLQSPDKLKSDPKSYRPICLLSAWSKILERLFVTRLNEDCLSNNVNISGNQFGFTKNKSTQDAWLRLIEILDVSKSKYILVLFVDFTGAFDNIKWSAILSKLREVNSKDINLWNSYFKS